ncbi:MAG: hypothetical protein ABSE89_11045 [Sedimentisphaerales bacterium]
MFVCRYCPITLLLLVFFCGSVYGLEGSTAAYGSNAQAVHDLGITGSRVNIGVVELLGLTAFSGIGLVFYWNMRLSSIVEQGHAMLYEKSRLIQYFFCRYRKKEEVV